MKCPCIGCGGQCICDEDCGGCVNVGCEWWYSVDYLEGIGLSKIATV